MSEYQYLTTTQAVEEAAHKLLTSKALIGVDLETTGVDPFLDVPLLAAFGKYLVPTNNPKMDIRPLWQGVMESREVTKVFHNLAFDAMHFVASGVFPVGCTDTMLGAMLLKLGLHVPRGTYRLGNLLERLLGIPMDKTLQTSFVGADPVTFRSTPEQREYLWQDVKHLPDLARCLAGLLGAKGLMPAWKLENAYAPVIAMMHVHGVLVDINGYLPELERAESEFTRLEEEVSGYLTPYILEVRRKRFERDRATLDQWQTAYLQIKEANHDIVYGKGVTKGTKEQLARYNELNKQWQAEHKRPATPHTNDRPILVTSGQQIKAALIEWGIEVPDTKKESLYLARAGRSDTEQQALRLLGDLSEVKKIRTNEGREMLSRLRPTDTEGWGLLTTRFGQLQATGRLSSAMFKDGARCKACGVQNPVLVEDDDEEETGKVECVACGAALKAKQWGSNMQNLTKRLKKHAHPHRGNKFIIADYGQIELRVGADLVLRDNPKAEDAIVRAFRDGVDPHSDMAADIKGMSYKDFVAWLESGDPEAKSTRQAGKTTNFSATFFIGAPKLAVGIYIARKDSREFSQAHIDEAQGLLDLYWQRNPTLKKVLDRYGDQALEQGYVETLGGLRRHFEMAPGMPKWMKGSIKRRAANVPIQGTAAQIAKLGQVKIYKRIMEVDPDAFLWAAVHDEVCLECAEDLAPAWEQAVRTDLTEAFETYIKHVPCDLACGVQDTWEH